MPATWTHPTLGPFKFDSPSWQATIDMPAFKAFSYDTGYPNAPQSTGKHVLAFDAEDENDFPSDEAVALADKVLAYQTKLVKAITSALWDDFQGEGPGSGMWWHGDLDQVTESLEGLDGFETPECADDILPMLQVAQVTVRKDVHDYHGPIVEISLHAPFEEEHGVGILTDGHKILGIGYMSDTSLFEDE